MNRDYQSRIGEARIAVYDSIVAGKPFAEMANDVIAQAMCFGEHLARQCSMSLDDLTGGIEFEITDNLSYNHTQLRATAATEALGKMFTGDMAGVVTMLVDTGIRFGHAVERRKIAMRNPALAEMLEAIVASMKLTDSKVIPDAPVSAFFDALSVTEDRELAIHYSRRLLSEEGLKVNYRLPAVQKFLADFSHILM